MSTYIYLLSSSPEPSKKRKSLVPESEPETEPGHFGDGASAKRRHISQPLISTEDSVCIDAPSQLPLHFEATPVRPARGSRSVASLHDMDDIFDLSSPLPTSVIDLSEMPTDMSTTRPGAFRRKAVSSGAVSTAPKEIRRPPPDDSLLIDDWNDDSIFRLEEELELQTENAKESLPTAGISTRTGLTSRVSAGTSSLITTTVSKTSIQVVSNPARKPSPNLPESTVSKPAAPPIAFERPKNARDFDPITLSSSPEMPANLIAQKENSLHAARPSETSSRGMANQIMTSSQHNASPLARRQPTTGLKPSFSAPIIELGSDSENSDFPDLQSIRAHRPTAKDLGLDFDDLLSSPVAAARPRVASAGSSLATSGPAPRAKLARTESAMSALSSRTGGASTVAKAEARAEAKAAKEAEKARAAAERAEAKEQKKRDKARAAALAEVNKVRTDKKVSTPEMVVLLPVDLPETTTVQACTLLEDLEVRHVQWTSPVPCVVRWRRNVKSRYNKDQDIWEPVEPVVEDEKYAMVVMDAQTFVERVLATDENNMVAHVTQMQRCFAGYTLIYLLEGVTLWQQKNKNLRNRQFSQNVLGSDSSSTAAAAPRRGKKGAPGVYIDDDKIEDGLLELQVLHGHILIHHTLSALETAQWIATFTQHISTAPYRQARDAAAAAFCMQAGQVRSGEDAEDTYARMLQEIIRVTAPSAYGVAARFSSVQSLVRGLEGVGPLALQALPKVKNRYGDEADGVVGPAISRRMYKVFTGRDEASVDI
ncbi:hypothetical protein BROUX41_001104 [Berkeleyomyces rouxiae]|uniref:uncharacterized protein n=1 Tax=Berkeleyomyces rouxiae TaxID=2035830 RepID=UPI003B7CB7D6